MDLIALAAQVPLIGHLLPYIAALSALWAYTVAVCSLLATKLPAPSATTGRYAQFYALVNFIALNFGHARNAVVPIPEATPTTFQSGDTAVMKKTLLGLALAVLALAGALTACSQTQITAVAATAPGQLFCAFQLSGGGTMIAAMVDSAATATLSSAAPIAILATNQTKSFVDTACQQAALSIAGATSGVAVSPPSSSTTVATVAVSSTAVAAAVKPAS